MEPAAGLTFGHYELLTRIGAGGMGEVWRARDHSLERDVAVKFIARGALARPHRLARFQREAKAASALNHPNIVTIHEIGQEDDRPFIVLELVQGRSLREMLTGRPLPVKQALDIAGQVADGLARAHAVGIVHRDLKPDNVMVTPDGLVKVLDFGLAKLVTPMGPADAVDTDDMMSGVDAADEDGTTVSKTREGVVLGTAGYMSPEQARGHHTDHRSDQFSLGAILYEMLSGHRAFRKTTTMETLMAIVNDAPEGPPPSAPEPVAWILARLLAKDPEQRYASTLDLARDLRGAHDRVDELGSGSPRTWSGARAVGRTWRPRARAVLGVATVAVAAVLLSPLRERLIERFGGAPAVATSGHVAVLPFKYVGDNPEGQLLCEGLVDILNSKLTQLEQFQGALTVVPASEVVSAGVNSPSAARRRFGATLVITGTVRESGGRVRANANLVDAETLRQVRSVEVEEAAGDLFQLEDRLLERLIEMLRMRPGSGARQVLAAGRTDVDAAYEAYVQARGLLQRYDRAGNLDAAIALLERALHHDPGYGLAHAALGEARWRQYQQSHKTDLVAPARASCERALALDARLVPAHVTLAMIEAGSGRPRDALAHAERALGLDPVHAEAHRERARALEDLREYERAEEAYRRAVSLRPQDWSVHNQLGAFLMARGRPGEAQASFARITELAPDNVQGWNNLGSAAYAQDRLDEARVAWETSVRIAPNATASSNLGTLAFYQGRYADAARAFQAAVKERGDDHRVWSNLASALHWSGQREAARAAWEKAVEVAERERAVNPADGRLVARLATAYAMLGRAREAKARLAEALAAAPGDARVMFTAGEIHEQLGERVEAIRWIQSALAAGYSPREVERAPSLKDLRADPRFGAARSRT